MYIWLIYIALALALGSTAWAARSFAPWVPTWKKDLPRIFRLAQLQPGEVFYDLGCGNGKVVVYAVRHYAVQAIGVELSVPLWCYCVVRRWLAGATNAQFRFGNLFRQNLTNADVVYVFGMPQSLQKKLLAKLQRELKPGARVISYTFAIHGLQPVAVDKPTPKDITIYLYQF